MMRATFILLSLFLLLSHTTACSPARTSTQTTFQDNVAYSLAIIDKDCVRWDVFEDEDYTGIFNPITVFELERSFVYDVAHWKSSVKCDQGSRWDNSCKTGCPVDYATGGKCLACWNSMFGCGKKDWCFSVYTDSKEEFRAFKITPVSSFTASMWKRDDPSYTPTAGVCSEPLPLDYALVPPLRLGQVYSPIMSLVSWTPTVADPFDLHWFPNVNMALPPRYASAFNITPNYTLGSAYGGDDYDCRKTPPVVDILGLDITYDDGLDIYAVLNPAGKTYTAQELLSGTSAVVYTMSGLQVIHRTMSPIVDPCSNSIFWFDFEQALSLTIETDALNTLNAPCMLIQEFNDPLGTLSILRFDPAARVFMPYAGWVGAVSNNYVKTYQVRAVDTVTPTPPTLIIPYFSASVQDTNLLITVTSRTPTTSPSPPAASTYCTIRISDTCSRTVTPSSVGTTLPFVLTSCGDLYPSGLYQCGVAAGQFHYPLISSQAPTPDPILEAEEATQPGEEPEESWRRLAAKKKKTKRAPRLKKISPISRPEKSYGRKIREHFQDFSPGANWHRAFVVILTMIGYTIAVKLGQRGWRKYKLYKQHKQEPHANSPSAKPVVKNGPYGQVPLASPTSSNAQSPEVSTVNGREAVHIHFDGTGSVGNHTSEQNLF